MVIALPPSAILTLLDISMSKMLLGKKESDPALWRNLSDAKKGKTRKVQRKTKDKIERLLTETFKRWSGVKPSNSDLLEQIPNGSEWETCIAAYQRGLSMAGGEPPDFFMSEALRLDRASRPIRALIDAGDFECAMQELRRSDMPSTPSINSILDQLECKGGSERFYASVSPIVIPSTLYLLACWEIDNIGEKEPSYEVFLPIMRDGKKIRPMTRWLDYLSAKFDLTTKRELANLLLADIDEDTSVPELKKWYYHGIFPAWTRVPTIATSLAQKFCTDDRKQIEFELISRLAGLRLLNGLLDLGVNIRDKHSPTFDPMAAFQDYSLIRAYVRERKKGLPTATDRQPRSPQSSSFQSDGRPGSPRD